MDITGVQIGRQFWVSDTTEALGNVIGTHDPASSPSTEDTSLTRPDKSFVNYVHGGKGGQFASAITAAKIDAFKDRVANGVASSAEMTTTAKANLLSLFGSDDLDDYALNLARRVVGNEASVFRDWEEAATQELLKKSLVSLLNMSEVKNLADTHTGNVSSEQWDRTAEARSLAIDNAVLGIAELISKGVVDETSVLYVQDGKVLSVNNYTDLAKVMTDTAKAAQKTFVDEDALRNLATAAANRATQFNELLQNGLSNPGDASVSAAWKSIGQSATDGAKEIEKAVNDLIAARKAASDKIKTTARTTDASGAALSDKEIKAELQKISNSTRTFRYSMDQHVKRQGEGFGTKVRRFFSNIFFRDKASRVTDAAFKNIQKAEENLQKKITSFLAGMGTTGGVGLELDFSRIDHLSKESGDLTHMANSLLRNCSKQVDKSYDAYTNRALALFNGALNAESGSAKVVKTFTMTCKLGAEIAFDFGIGSGKAGADLQRKIDVAVYPGGAITLSLSKGADVHANVQVSPATAEAGAEYLQGKVLYYDNFDKFVAAAYGKLALPVTDDEKDEKVVGSKTGKDVKFLGDTSGNAAKRIFRSLGFLEFGSPVDTQKLLQTLHDKKVMQDTTAMINGLDSNQGHVASAKEKTVHGEVSAGFSGASDDGTKNLAIGVGVEGVLTKRTDDVETVDIFDIVAGLQPNEIEDAFKEQMGSVRANIKTEYEATLFPSRTNLGANFDTRLEDIVAQAKGGTLSLADASGQIRNIIVDLQTKASAHAPAAEKNNDNARYEYWMGYACCLRACTLAQSVLETLANSETASQEIAVHSEEVHSLARKLRPEMPSKVYDENVMFGIRTKEEPWKGAVRLNLSGSLGIDGEESDKKIDLNLDGSITRVNPGKGSKVDEFRPWVTASARYVDINLTDGEVSETLLDEIVEKAVPKGADETAKTQMRDKITDLLTGAGVNVEGSSSGRSSRPKKGTTTSLRLEYGSGKQMVRFSVRSQKVTTQSQSVGKGPLTVKFTREAIDADELASLFTQQPLSRVMGDVEELAKGSLSGYVPPSLESYAARNTDVVIQFCKDLMAPNTQQSPNKTESFVMKQKMGALLGAIKNHPRYAKIAESYEKRLADFETELSSSGTHDDNWRLDMGTQFLLLATQTMRLASMFSDNPWDAKSAFLVGIREPEKGPRANREEDYRKRVQQQVSSTLAEGVSVTRETATPSVPAAGGNGVEPEKKNVSDALDRPHADGSTPRSDDLGERLRAVESDLEPGVAAHQPKEGEDVSTITGYVPPPQPQSAQPAQP